MGDPANTAGPRPRRSRVRFGVLGFVCALSFITYLDRVCISTVSENIKLDLSLTAVRMGFIYAAFQLGYAMMEVPAGWMGDAWGSRRVLTRIVFCWSVFTAMTGAVWQFSIVDAILLNSYGAMLLVRFLFGCGEAGAYPNIARVTGGWFPYRERGIAQGAVWMSARLGGAFAPWVIGRLSLLFGWRPAFWVLGALGITWGVLFYRWFRDKPEEMPGCNDAERDWIAADPIARRAAEGAHQSPPWGVVFTTPSIYFLCIVSAMVSFGWYFYPYWQPVFLREVFQIQPPRNEAFGILPNRSELLAGLPFLCGAAGALIGGKLSDWLVQVTGSRRWGRSLMGVVGFTGAGTCVLVSAFVTEAWQATALLCLAFFLNDLGIPPIWAACADIGGRFSGTVSGIMNMAGGAGSIVSPVLIPVMNRGLGYLPANERWRIIFIVLSCAWFIGAVAWACINAARPLEDPGHEPSPTESPEPPGEPDTRIRAAE